MLEREAGFSALSIRARDAVVFVAAIKEDVFDWIRKIFIRNFWIYAFCDQNRI